MGVYFIGARATFYEGADSPHSVIPYLLNSVIASASSLIDAMLRTHETKSAKPTHQANCDAADLSAVKAYFSGVTDYEVCPTELVTEIQLPTDTLSATLGIGKVAEWHLDCSESHPSLGAGLMGVLEMPHVIRDPNKLDEVISALNRNEMSGIAWPPHFGSWCVGRTDCNPAYVTFFQAN